MGTSAIELAMPRLKIEEGFRPKVYRDTQGFQTIGYGFNVDAGITKRAAEALCQAQVQELHEDLYVYGWYASLDEPRQSVCLDIAFNGGIDGLLGFKHMIEAIKIKDWPEAARQCHVINLELAPRYEALAKILLTGEV